METKYTYDVNGRGFNSFTAAIAAAKDSGAKVFEVRANGERLERWSPIPKSTRRRVSHVIVNADGTETPFGKVRR